METELKNGEKLKLEVTPLILEYLEDYEGGAKQLIKDAQGEKDKSGYTRVAYACNQLLYAIIASNYNQPLTYRQAVRLVKIEEMERIIDFIINSLPDDDTKNIEISTENHNHKF